ncbi:MAG: rubredoxin domain-containing protein [Cyclobacteriaceae bacterium]
MKVSDLVRVFVKGGIISPADLLKIVNVAEQVGSSHILLGSRQDIMFAVEEENKGLLGETFESINSYYEINKFEYQNIASSYVALDILPNRKWLTSSKYLLVLQNFSHRPSLRINIVDPLQSMVPLFTGNINFVASSKEDYWYLYVRFKAVRATAWCAPYLVYSDDLPHISEQIENLDLPKDQDYFQKLDAWMNSELACNKQPITEELVLPDANFPYYEGINRISDGNYWLGLYWRSNRFSLDIIRKICQKCLDTRLGKISLTPWKSVVIKGINEEERVEWEKLMGKNGMNLRHSALELNWHLPALDEEAYVLKHYLIQTLDAQDISTYGLTFTIKTTDDIVLFTSIVIERVEFETYNILYSRDFNPNLMEYETYASAVSKEVVAPLLIELTHIYYENLSTQTSSPGERSMLVNAGVKELYQCNSCMTVYDAQYGDAAQNIKAGTTFKNLPDTYECALCGAGKSEFAKI